MVHFILKSIDVHIQELSSGECDMIWTNVVVLLPGLNLEEPSISFEQETIPKGTYEDNRMGENSFFYMLCQNCSSLRF